MKRADKPLTGGLGKLPVAVELIDFMFMAGQHTHNCFAMGAQSRNGGAKRGTLAPRRADGRLQGTSGSTPTSSFKSRLKPTAGRLRPNTAPTSS